MKTARPQNLLAAVVCAVLLATNGAQAQITPCAVAKEAYIYGFPMVRMHILKRKGQENLLRSKNWTATRFKLPRVTISIDAELK